MAVTADVVEVRLEADTAKYLSDLRTADKTFAQITGNMEREAIAAGAAFSRIGANQNNAFKKIATDAPKATSAIKGTGIQTANLAAQFQDIAVQLQAGQSPFTIALQQGTQISAVLGPAGASGAVKALGAAFGALVSPISLATIAIITLGGFAVQWLVDIAQSAGDANKTVDEHVEHIKEIIKGYENAGDAVDDYIEKQDKLPATAARSELTQEQSKALEVLADRFREILTLQADFEAFAGYADAFNVPPEVTAQLETLRNLLQTVAADGKVTADEADALTNAFTLLKNETDDQNLKQIAEEALAVIANFKDATAVVEALGVAINNIPENVTVNVKVVTATGEGFNEALSQIKELAPELRDSFEVARSAAGAAYEQANALAQSYGQVVGAAKQYQETLSAIDAAEKKSNEKKGQGSRNKAINEAEKERQAVVDLIAALEFEQSIIGMTNEEKAIANALRKAGAAATEEQRLAIIALVEQTYAETEALDRQKQAYEDIKELAGSVLSGFINDIREGKSAGEAFAGVLDTIIDKLIEIALQAALNAIFPGLGSVAGLFGGARASGGPVSSGRSYLVGERGPEMFTPSSAGNITPNHQLGGGGATRIVLDVQEGAAFTTRVREVAGPQSVAITRGGLQTYDQALPGRKEEKDARYG